jgi:hypothetical protein
VDDHHQHRKAHGSPKESPVAAPKRTAELLGHFKASARGPGRSGDQRPGVEHEEHGEHDRIGHGRRGGHRARHAIRSFKREVHEALKDVRHGLRESGLSEEEMHEVGHELISLEKDFRSALKDARHEIRHGGRGNFLEAVSAVNEAFEGLVAGIEQIVSDREAPAQDPSGLIQISLQFVGSQDGSLEAGTPVATPVAPTEPAGETGETAPPSVTDHLAVSEEEGPITFDGRGLQARPQPLMESLREGFASLLSSLEDLSASFEAEPTDPEPQAEPTAVAVEPAGSGGTSFQLQLAISSYSEISLSISFQTGGERLNVLS